MEYYNDKQVKQGLTDKTGKTLSVNYFPLKPECFLKRHYCATCYNKNRKDSLLNYVSKSSCQLNKHKCETCKERNRARNRRDYLHSNYKIRTRQLKELRLFYIKWFPVVKELQKFNNERRKTISSKAHRNRREDRSVKRRLS